MPIGIVSDEDFSRSLSDLCSPTNVVPSVTIQPLPTKGRNEGDVNIPDPLRKIIGETAVIDGRQSALGLAKEFGISPSSVSAYTKGSTSTASYNSPSKEIIQHINRARGRAIKKSSRVLNAALESITQDKLDYTDARDLSGIAKDMSVIIKNLEPQAAPGSDESKPAPQFVIYAPTFRDERSFESITVKE
jgi:transcriptional regulator with XRE-family HTH domain